MPGAETPARVHAVALTDFGLAKDVATGSKFTRSGETLGTPRYMSPEQARGELADLAPASDVWALGCVLYELLGNRPAFGGETPAAVVGNLLTREPPALPGLPGPVRELLAAALAKSAGARPSAAGGFRDDCERVLRDELPRTRAPRTRRPARWIGAVALALVGAILIAVLATRGSDRAPVDARTDAERWAADGWDARRRDPAAAATLVARAVAAVPNRWAWRIRLGLLYWSAGDDAAAVEQWRAVPDSAPESTRARWLRGLSAYARNVGRFEDESWYAADTALQHAARGTPPESRWAWALRELMHDRFVDLADVIGDAAGWEAALLEAVIIGDDRNPATDDHAAARAYLRAADQGVPLPWVYFNLAVTYRDLGNDAAAARAYDQALALRPEYHSAAVNRGGLRLRAGDLDGAQADYELAVRLRPMWPEGWLGLGELAGARRDWAAASAAFDRAIELEPQNPAVWAARADGYIHRKDYAAAVADATRAIELAPDRARYHNGRAIARRFLGDFAGALVDTQTAVKLDPRSAKYLYNLGFLKEQTGDLDGAMECYDRVLELSPDEADALNNRAQLHDRRGDHDAAMADFDRAVAADPNLVNARANRGSLRRRLGDLAGARADYDHAIRVGDNPALPYCNRGWLRQTQGDLVGAREDYDRAIEHNPNMEQAWINRGLLRRDQGDTAGGTEDLRAATRAQPMVPKVWLALSDTLAQDGDYAGAAAALERLLALTPSPAEEDLRRLERWRELARSGG